MFRLFGLKKQNLNSGNIKNLIAIAKADGVITDSERDFLYKIGKKFNMSNSEIDSSILDSSKITYTMPSNNDERFDHLYELIHLMIVDGDIDENELSLCIEIGKNLGFEKKVITTLVRRIFSAIKNNINVNELKAEILATL